MDINNIFSLVVCGVVAYCFGSLKTSIGSLNIAIRDMQIRDEQGREKSERQGQWIGRLIERTRNLEENLQTMTSTLRAKGIEVNFTASTDSGQIQQAGEGLTNGDRFYPTGS